MILTSFLSSRNGHKLLEDLSFLAHEPEEEFRAKSTDYLDDEQIDDFKENAFLFHKRRQGLLPPLNQRDDVVERAALVRILRGRDYYQNHYAFGDPIDPKTGKPYNIYSSEYRQWATDQDKPVLSAEQANLVKQISFGLHNHPKALELLDDGIAEGTIRSNYCDVPCQARIDWLNPHRGIVGVVVESRMNWAESSIRNGIVHSLALQRDLVAELAGQNLPVHVIVVEKEAPHRCGVWNIHRRLLRQARKENISAIKQYRRCLQNDLWPSGFEKVRVLKPFGF